LCSPVMLNEVWMTSRTRRILLPSVALLLVATALVSILDLRRTGAGPSEHVVELANSFERLHTLEFPGLVDLAWSPDSNTLATESQQGSLTFWNVITGQPITSSNEENFARGITWSPDGEIVAVNGYTNTIRLLDGATYQPVRSVTVPTPEPSRLNEKLAYPLFFPEPVGWLPNTYDLISLDSVLLRASTLPNEMGNASYTNMHLWDADTGSLLCGVPISSDESATGLAAKALSPDGSTLATITQTWVQDKLSYGLKLWEVRTCQLIRFIEDIPLGKFDFSLSDEQLAWSPDGSMIAYGAENLAVNLLNVSTGKVERSLPETVPLTYTPTPPPTIRPWPTYPPTPVSTIPVPRRTDVAFGPVSTRPPPGFTPATPTSIFSPTPSETPTPAPTPTADREVYSSILQIAWSPDERTLLVHDWNAIRLWDTRTGKLLQFIGFDSQSYPQWSPDGSLLIASGPDDIAILDPVTGSHVGKLPVRHGRNLIWSPNGRVFAVASSGSPGNVEIWRVKDSPPADNSSQEVAP
jgi:WD40 repeat protein